MDDEDDDEPYCLICGRWVHMFHGFEGWWHFRGEGTAARPVELFDPDHAPDVEAGAGPDHGDLHGQAEYPARKHVDDLEQHPAS